MPLVYFVTLSRSDYTSLRPVARAALADTAVDTKIIVGGSHLLKRYGNTIEQVKSDGLPIHEVANFLLETDDSPVELATAYARAVQIFVELFSKGNPDYVFVIGDRWEMLAVVSAASQLRIPVVHHSGGDITQGSADNQIRYALTCLSHIHLVALDQHRERLLCVGEEPWRIITTGEPALTELLSCASAKTNICSVFGLKPDQSFVLATFHPTTFTDLTPEQQINRFLQVLDNISEGIILTASNPDAASDVFSRQIKEYVKNNPRVKFYESLGTEYYYAAMAKAQYMIGNSSSGLWEAPSFNLPVVNIGSRQQGRVHGENVINVPMSLPEILSAIQQVTDPAFRKKLLSNSNPYVRINTLELILDTLKQPYDRARLLAKHFVDPLSLSREAV